MKHSQLANYFRIAFRGLVVMGLFASSSAFAQEVIVFNHYQEVPGKQVQLSQVIDKEVSKKLAGVKGLEWMKFYHDPASGARGSVFLWKSQADWQAYFNSDLRRELVGRVKPYIQGTVESKSYPVYDPKK